MDLASSDNEEHGEDEEDDEDDSELGKLSEDDEPSWVMGTICTTVQHCMGSFRQQQKRFENLRNRDRGMQLTTSVREISSVGWPHCWFRQLSRLKQTRLQPHHHRQHLESLCRVFIFSQDNRKCRRGHLDQEVLKRGSTQRNHAQQRYNISPAHRATQFVID